MKSKHALDPSKIERLETASLRPSATMDFPAERHPPAPDATLHNLSTLMRLRG
jgi:hypothetical protein